MQSTFFKRPLLSGIIATLFACAATSVCAADIKERNIKFPIVNQMDHPQGLGAKKFADLVEQKSGGKMKVKVYSGGTSLICMPLLSRNWRDLSLISRATLR